MNQIMICKKSKAEYSKKVKNIIFNSMLYASISFSLVLFFYVAVYYYNLTQNEIISKKMLLSYNISSLYYSDNRYKTSYINNSEPLIIGTLEIPKINLKYPILSYSDEENLNISPCRFAGPLPNQIGNLCIAGHNNIDNSFFGRLYLLKIGDIIRIFDNKKNYKDYAIYTKYEIEKNNFECTSQDTFGKRIVTLMTCNSIKDTRIILKAEETSI